MSWIDRWRFRARGLRRRRLEAEFEEELQFHLKRLADDHAARGADRDEARRRARREFGEMLALKADLRHAHGVSAIDALAHDLRDAARQLLRSAGFTAASVLTLAVGIAAAAALSSLVDATLLRPLPVTQPHQLVQSNRIWSYPDLQAVRSGQQTLAALGGWSRQPRLTVEHAGRQRVIEGAAVTGAYFPMTGLPAAAGRLLGDEDDRPGAPPVAVIGATLWQAWFDRHPGVIGSSIRINGVPVTVVGVAPEGFRGYTLRDAPDVYVPVHALPLVGTGFAADPAMLADDNVGWLLVAGRLHDDVPIERAESGLNRILRSRLEDPSAALPTASLQPATTLALGAGTGADLRSFLIVLGGATGVVLLLACVTVANLMLVRATRRRGALAVRAALGASRGRLVRLLLLESLGIGLAAGVLAVPLAAGGLRLLAAFHLPGGIPIDDLALTPNARVLAVAFGCALATSVVFGLPPAWRASRIGPNGALGTGRITPRQRLPRTLVAAQVAACVLLLAGGLAFGRAVRAAFDADLGFQPAALTLTQIDPTLARYTPDRTRVFEAAMLEAMRTAPWVEAAAWSMSSPTERWLGAGFNVDGNDPSRTPDPQFLEADAVSPGYFDAMGIPMLAGRDFGPDDQTGAARVTVVSAGLATRVWGGPRAALGRRIAIGGSSTSWMTVVGVAGDVRRGPGLPPANLLYVPMAQVSDALDFGDRYLIVRSSGDPAAAAGALEALSTRVDPLVPVVASVPMEAEIGGLVRAQRLGRLLFAMFASLAALLAGFGLYAVAAAAVAQRGREIVLRMALGAAPWSVARLVIRQGLGPIVAGVAVGTAGFVWLSASLERFLLGVPALDIAAWSSLVLLVALLATASMLVPVRRATRLDPAVVLRLE